MYIARLVKHFKNRFFPSAHYLMVKKWYADGGDYALRYALFIKNVKKIYVFCVS